MMWCAKRIGEENVPEKAPFRNKKDRTPWEEVLVCQSSASVQERRLLAGIWGRLGLSFWWSAIFDSDCNNWLLVVGNLSTQLLQYWTLKVNYCKNHFEQSESFGGQKPTSSNPSPPSNPSRPRILRTNEKRATTPEEGGKCTRWTGVETPFWEGCPSWGCPTPSFFQLRRVSSGNCCCDLRFAIRITNRNHNQIPRFGALRLQC